MAVQTVIKMRRDTAANWTSTNPTLAAGESGLESDTGKIKVGNGSTAWASLGYSNPGGAIPQSQVTNLTTDLAGKAAGSHTHAIADLTSFSVSTPANKQVLQYDSATSLWKNATISAGVTVSDTAPASPSVGDQWYNSVEGRTYVYYDSFWVDSNPGLVGPAGADGTNGTNGTNGVDGGFNSTQTIAALASGVTLSSVDVGKLFTGGGATVTVQGLSVGQQVDFVQTSASQIIFAAGSGMTLNSKGGLLKTAAQYSPATIKCVATNTYILLGDLGA